MDSVDLTLSIYGGLGDWETGGRREVDSILTSPNSELPTPNSSQTRLTETQQQRNQERVRQRQQIKCQQIRANAAG